MKEKRPAVVEGGEDELAPPREASIRRPTSRSLSPDGNGARRSGRR